MFKTTTQTSAAEWRQGSRGEVPSRNSAVLEERSQARLTSNRIVLTNESQAQSGELHQTDIETFRPANGVEIGLIVRMVASQWRLRRIRIMQTAAFDLKMNQQDAEIAENFH